MAEKERRRAAVREGSFVCGLRLSIVGLSQSLLPSPSSLHVRGNFLDSWQSRERRKERMEVGNREGWEDGSKEGRTRDRRAARLFCLTAPFKVRRRRGPLFHGEGPTVLKGDGGD